jgi:hypothetical protein
MSTENDDQARAYGVTFGPLKRALREHQYPVTAAELIEQYGGFELATAAGDERLESALEGCERSTFTEPWEVRDAILNGLDDDAVVGYHGAPDNDRGSDSDEEDGDPDTGETETATIDAVGDWSQLSG